jgi:septal ring factor EnvC (AmiA/AmiB activator)
LEVDSMSESTHLFSKKGLWICVLAALVVCAWMCADAFAGNKKSNPSDQGAANGVAHRVAALEAALAETQTDLAEAQQQIAALDADLATVEGQVADLEDRVAALESAAAP